MDYEKAYKDALERAKDYYKANQKLCETEENEVLSDIFPELAESDGERIRKALIEYFTTSDNNTYYAVCGVATKKILAWLERQGEQKPIDKVEPKFKVGEFVINSYDFIMKVVDIKEESYWYIVIGGNEEKILNCTFRKMEESCHLWDISDAKDGDVLTSTWKGCSYIYIFKEVDNNIIISHIFYYPELDAIDMGVINTDNTPTIPATKEQRDLLYQKIHDAGYEWDEEKKEVKKKQSFRERYKNIANSDWFKRTHENMSVDIYENTDSNECYICK